MISKKSGSGFASKFIILVFLALVGVALYLYYIDPTLFGYLQPVKEDPYSARLESLNEQIYQLHSTSAISPLRSSVLELEAELRADGSYPAYLELTQAQLATLDAMETYYLYLGETREYSLDGINCEKDYSQIISDLNNAQSEVSIALSKINAYLDANPESNASLLKKKVQSIDVKGMYVFANIFEDVYRLDCPVEETPSTTFHTPLSRDDAITLVINEIVKSNNYYVYSTGDAPLPKGTVISAIRGGDYYNITLDSNTWFFFVDTNPLAPFAHQTYFVFVDQNTAEFSVRNESFYPIINDISYFSTFEERMDEYWRVYPEGGNLTYNLSSAEPVIPDRFTFKLRYREFAIAEIPFGTPVPFDSAKCCEGVSKKHAIVITGYDEPMFIGDTQVMYDYLKGQGFADAEIKYLTASSGDSPNSDGKTALSTINDAFQELARNAECCDEVFIYFSGHGAAVQFREWENNETGEKKWVEWNQAPGPDMTKWNPTGNTEDRHRITMNPEFTTPRLLGFGTKKHGSSRGGRMWDEDFAALLDNVKSCDMTIMYFSCFSGAAPNNLKGKGRTVITPVGNDPAWGFTGQWGNWQAGSIFTQNFIRAKNDNSIKNAVDSDGDGTVSDREAFNYARTETSNYVNANMGGATQVGTWTDPEACKCCHVECNDALNCAVVPGEGIDSPDCSFVGDYCGPLGSSCGNGYINLGEECESDMDCSYGSVCRECKCIPRDELPPVCGDGTVSGTEECEDNSDCGTGEVCIGCSCFSDMLSSCGDGVITGSEKCDHGNYSTNKCPQGQYCKDCDCKPIETSVVCGDGKISSPGEDCDGGNVLYNKCPEGQECKICKCVPVQSTCGDGKIQGSEKCDHGNTITARCDSGLTCSGCKCVPLDSVKQTHKECSSGSCVVVEGAGTDECSSNAECRDETPVCGDGNVEGSEQCESNSHCSEGQVCSNCRCVDTDRVQTCGNGVVEGSEQCESDSGCQEGQVCRDCLCYTVTVQPYCGDGNKDAGEECESTVDCGETGVCSNCRCIAPPTLDCDHICSYTPGARSFGGSYEDENACDTAVGEYYGTTTCYLTCSYSWYYQVTNVAGTASCCCGMKKMFPCVNCPCEGESCAYMSCPDSETTCDANAPSWYMP